MKLPISWLREYVDVEASAEELADRLTASGTEVGSIERIGGQYGGVVVGEVIDVRPHPSADRLSLCRVNTGLGIVNVVCGAPNLEVGAKVPFIAAGGTLPGGGAPIRRAKIRGEWSEGMLCAEDELGISDDHSGIVVLPAETLPGTPFAQVAPPPDAVLNLEVTWNRPDCLSIIGLAREVSALFGSRLRLPAVDFPETGEPVRTLADVQVEDRVGCPRYTARVLTSVCLGPSPAWMQRRLTLCGLRPINNVVDITNYVMLECGQPLHAFDYDLLSGHRIVVRRAKSGETMATLDGVDRPITPDVLVIADSARPVAVAGVMGGQGSEIRPETQRVLLESATFPAAAIRLASSRLGLSTESAFRFERGVASCWADWASRRAVALMVALAKGTVASGVIDTEPVAPAGREIECRFRRVHELLGVAVPEARVVGILESLGMTVTSRTPVACTVQVPAYRLDLEVEADLVEEVVRVHGLNSVPDRVPKALVVEGAGDARPRAIRSCRSHLAGLGLSEIVNYSFVSESLLDVFGVSRKAQRVALPNPVSAEHGILRDSLIPQMVDTLGRNLARQVKELSLFEIGRVFRREGRSSIGEEERVCVGLMGPVGCIGPGRRRKVEPEEIFLWLKGIVVSLCDVQHAGEVKVTPREVEFFEAGWSVAVCAGDADCGVLGLIGEEARRAWRMADPVAVAEMDLGSLVRLADRTPVLRPIPVYPSVERDVAMVVGEGVRHDQVEAVIRNAAPAELTRVELFDTFRGEAIGRGRKSLAYSLTFRSTERTLTDEDANRHHQAIKEALRNKLGAEIREGS